MGFEWMGINPRQRPGGIVFSFSTLLVLLTYTMIWTKKASMLVGMIYVKLVSMLVRKVKARRCKGVLAAVVEKLVEECWWKSNSEVKLIQATDVLILCWVLRI